MADVLGDCVARERRSADPALRDARSGRAYDYRRFCTTAWKAGNFLRHLGVRSGRRVGVAGDAPEAVLTCYGAALLGAVVRFDPPEGFECRAVVAPTGDLPAAEPGVERVTYGEEHEDPSVAYFERDVWSENPTMPPDRVAPDDDLLAPGDRTFTHGEVLAAAGDVADRWSLGAGDAVAVDAPLSEPGTVAAGLVAPVLAGGTVVLGSDSDADHLVGDGGVQPADVL
jgi:hypothetical protein